MGTNTEKNSTPLTAHPFNSPGNLLVYKNTE